MLCDAVRKHGSSKRHRLENEGSDYSDSSFTTSNWSWMVVVGVFIIQLTVPTVLSCYGVVLFHLVQNNSLFVWQGLLPPVAYITTRSFAGPVCRNVLSGQSLNSKRITICGVLMTASSVAMNAYAQSIYLQVLTLGILGGVSTSMVVTQAEAVLTCHFPAQKGLTQVVSHLGVALGHFGMPVLMNGLINNYGIHGSFVLHSGFIMHALIGAVLLHPPRNNSSSISLTNRPRAYTVINDIEMVDLSSTFNNGQAGKSPPSPSNRNWKNPGTVSDMKYDVAQTSSPVTSMRHKNINGVDILPEIPEESEENSSNSDSDSDNFSSDISQEQFSHKDMLKYTKNKSFKHRTKSANGSFESVDQNKQCANSEHFYKWRNVSLGGQNRIQGNKKNDNGHSSIINVHDDGYSEEATASSSLIECTENTMKFQRLESFSQYELNRPSILEHIRYYLLCGCCNKLYFYDCYITILNFPNYINFYMITPLLNAIKVPSFFPAVFIYAVLQLNLALFTTFVPNIVRSKVERSSSQEAAFAVSIAAFSWLCFLLFSPCFSQAKTSTKKLIYFIGCISLSAGLYLVSNTRRQVLIVVGSALFGLGHGAVSGVVISILEDDIGLRPFVKLQGTLDTVSGCLVLLISLLLGVLLQDESELSNCFIILAVLQMMTGVMWILSLLKATFTYLRSTSNAKWHPAEDFFGS